MGKIDKTKESISYLKVVFGVLIAVTVSLAAWLFQHSNELEEIKLIISLITVVLLTLSIILVNKKILQKIDSLEDM